MQLGDSDSDSDVKKESGPRVHRIHNANARDSDLNPKYYDINAPVSPVEAKAAVREEWYCDATFVVALEYEMYLDINTGIGHTGLRWEMSGVGSTMGGTQLHSFSVRCSPQTGTRLHQRLVYVIL